MTYHDARSHDLMIICNMVYMLIISTFTVTMICGEDNLITQAIFLITGAALNLVAAVLSFYHYHNEKTSLGIDNACSITIGTITAFNALIMGVDFVITLNKLI